MIDINIFTEMMKNVLVCEYKYYRNLIILLLALVLDLSVFTDSVEMPEVVGSRETIICFLFLFEVFCCGEGIVSNASPFSTEEDSNCADEGAPLS